jgi:hypothetical protein
VHRVLDTLAPLPAPAPVRRRPGEQVAIVAGTLIPARDHRLAARSTNYRYAATLQIAIDAGSRLVIAVGDRPPGHRTDTLLYRSSGMNGSPAARAVMADGGHRGNPEVIISYRQPSDGGELPARKRAYHAHHRGIRAGAGHAPAGLRTYQILRGCRRAGHILATTAASRICTTSPWSAEPRSSSRATPSPSYETSLSAVTGTPPESR